MLKCMYVCMYLCIYVWMYGCMDVWLDECMAGWMYVCPCSLGRLGAETTGLWGWVSLGT